MRWISRIALGVIVLLALTGGTMSSHARGENDPVTYRGKPAAFWLRQFKDRDPAFRVEALTALKGIGEVDASVHPVLIGALKDPAESVRLAAVRALAEIGRGDKAIVSALFAAVRDRTSTVRVAAIGALRELSPDSAELLRVLTGALKDTDAAVRNAALEAIAKLGPAAQKAVPEVIASLQYSDRSTVVPALHAIDPTWEKSYPLLIKALTHQDPTTRQRAATIVRWFSGQPSGPISYGEDCNPPFREAIKAIRSKKADEVLPLLITALNDRSSSVRQAVLDELSQFGPAAQSAIPALLEKLRVEDTGLVDVSNYLAFDHLAQTLQAIDPKLERSAPVLLQVLRDKNALTRRNAIHVLKEWSWRVRAKELPALQKAIPAVLQSLQDSDEDVRQAALSVLRAIGPETQAVSAHLEILRTDKSESNRAVAARDLGGMGSAARTVVPALVQALKEDKSYYVRKAAIDSLGSLGAEAASALPVLRAALVDPDSTIRCAAIEALSALGPHAKAAVPDLLDAAKDPDEDVRKKALQALEHIDLKAARSAAR